MNVPCCRLLPSTSALAAAVVLALLAQTAVAQEPDAQKPEPTLMELQRRVDEQAAMLKELMKQQQDPAAKPAASGFEMKYDKGYVMRSTDPSSPFELRINGRMQFRYTGFAPDIDTYENLETAATGTPVDVKALSEVEIERGRLEFRGTWIDPKMHWFINLDADTDDAHAVIFHDFWFNYEFSKAFDLYVGKAFVPGSRDWLNGSTRTHFADRSMATTYFRTDRTLGVWAIGEPVGGVWYRAMIGNGLSTSDLLPDQVNNKPAYSASVWFEPMAKYGSGYADMEEHKELAAQMGASISYGQQGGVTSTGASVGETRFLRLSDGSRLTSLGVDAFDESLMAVDAAFKYRGLSLHGEVFHRCLTDLTPLGAPPASYPDGSVTDTGGYVEAGAFLISKTLEPVVRYSTIHGKWKDSHEYAVGLNWYVDQTHNNKFTMDVTWLDGSPVSNSGSGYRVGDDGIGARLQWQIAF